MMYGLFGCAMNESKENNISQRKSDHIQLAAHEDVGFANTTTLFECVRLVHNSLPELSYDELDLSVNVLGKRLRAPILIAAMTGGTEQARRVNLDLASICEERGYALGLGSQRAILKDRRVRSSYDVRGVAPNILLMGNIGVVQAKELSDQQLSDLVGQVGADALCVHLNPAQELIQTDGDRDFRGGLDTLSRLNESLSVPVIVKETGCGLSEQVAQRLHSRGIRHVDVSGAGGTSWVKVESLRAGDERRAVGECFSEWGIPTAATVALAAAVGFKTLIATGGVKTGLDMAKALALGAHAAGLARPVLKALLHSGRAAASAFVGSIEEQLRVAMLLSGCRTPEQLRHAPRVIHAPLSDWLGADCLGTERLNQRQT